jgi:hypothetical protein
MHPFRNLLLISLGRDTSFEKDPTPDEWKRLYRTACRQALIGSLNEGVHRLPAHQMPPEDILKEWDENTAKIARIYHRHEEHVKELETLLGRLNLHGCILKGTGLSHLYPVPERRMCGDIDLWIDGKRDDILKAFEDAGIKMYDVVYMECKAALFLDTEVEVHFHPSKMLNPFLNARLQRFFKKNSPIRDNVAITYPDAEFNAVFCMAHMFRHYLVGGIGMRQMLDYYYVLRNLAPSDREPVMKTLRWLGMKRFTASVMASMWYNFGLEKEFFLCRPDMEHGKKLVNDTYAMGNFGVNDKRNYSYEGESGWARFRRKNGRVFSNLRYYPREVIWSPFARVSQYVWRKLKGYL